jgi:hypothetical protein
LSFSSSSHVWATAKNQFAIIGFVFVYLFSGDACHAHAIVEPVFKVAKCFGVQSLDIGFGYGTIKV